MNVIVRLSAVRIVGCLASCAFVDVTSDENVSVFPTSLSLIDASANSLHVAAS